MNSLRALLPSFARGGSRIGWFCDTVTPSRWAPEMCVCFRGCGNQERVSRDRRGSKSVSAVREGHCQPTLLFVSVRM